MLEAVRVVEGSVRLCRKEEKAKPQAELGRSWLAKLAGWFP